MTCRRLLIGFLLFLPSVCLAGAGDLDPSFSEDGIVTPPPLNQMDSGRAILVLPDGKILVGGYSDTDPSPSFGLSRMTLWQFNADGTADTTFGDQGRVIIDFGPDRYELLRAMVRQPDGKIVVGGETNQTDPTVPSSNRRNFALARLSPNGILDNDFGGDGLVITDMGTNDSVHGLAIDASGRIVAGGSSTPDRFAVARYDSSGIDDTEILDTTFSGDGKVTTDVGESATVSGMLLQPDNKPVLFGASRQIHPAATDNDFTLVRYTTTGDLDSSFGGDGIVLTDFGGTESISAASIRLPSGKIIAFGAWTPPGGTPSLRVVRYLSTGSDATILDPSFTIVDFDLSPAGSTEGFFGLAPQPDGSFVTTLYYHNGTNLDFTVARFQDSPGGLALDTTFADDGMAVFPIGPGDDQAYAVTLDPVGRIVAAGYSRQTTSTVGLAVARYLVSEAAELVLSGDTSGLSATRGQEFTFDFSVLNRGPEAAPPVTFVSPLPLGVTWVGAEPQAGCSYNEGSREVSCNLGPLDPAATVTTSITVYVEEDAPETLAGSASISSTLYDPNLANNEKTVNILAQSVAQPAVTPPPEEAAPPAQVIVNPPQDGGNDRSIDSPGNGGGPNITTTGGGGDASGGGGGCSLLPFLP